MQSGTGRANDRVEWRLTNVDGANANLNYCLVFGGADYCSSFGVVPFACANGLDVTNTMGWDDANGNLLTGLKFTIGNTFYDYSGYTAGSNYPALGSMSFFFSSTTSPRPIITNLKLATSTTLTVTLSVCINDADWSALFYSLTKANPATTAVQVRPSQQNANCKGAVHAKGLVSGFTFVVESVGVPAQAIAEAFASAAAGPEGVALGITSTGVVAGSQGALAAGLPSSILAGPGSTGVATAGEAIAAGAGGGGGGAGGGLSGGSIAGIVIGSVAGGVIVLGVTGIVVAAVVVAAVVVARRDTDSPTPVAAQPSSAEPSAASASEKRGLRRTIVGLFGGVDMMNNPGKGHQSITGRTPAMRTPVAAEF